MNRRSALARHRAPRVQMEYKIELNGVIRKVELPFITGVMTDLSGTPQESLKSVSDREFVEISESNFEAFMASIKSRVYFRVPNSITGIGELSVDVTFTSMADFSPTAVVNQLALLRSLDDARKRLDKEGSAIGIDAIEFDTALAASMIKEISDKIGEQLNLILHHPEFQRLESAWRGLHYLVSHTETDEMLTIKVLNISKKELAKTLKKFKGTAWDQSPIFKKIYRDEYNRSGGTPFDCLVGDYYFANSPADVELLSELAKICASAHVPFISAASSTVMYMDSWQELNNPRDLAKIFQTPDLAAWRALRDSEDARYLMLTLPRFLARKPYDPEFSSADGFSFAEDIAELDQSKCVWANSAYLMAANILRSFKIHGWCSKIVGLQGGGAIEGLPDFGQVGNDGILRKLCPTEIEIDARREQELAKLGFVSLIHRKHSDMAVFISSNSMQKPVESYDPDVTANAQICANFRYLFATCRLAHYLKAIVNDKFSPVSNREETEQWLNEWISDYVDADPTTPQAFYQHPKPLAAAEIVLEEMEGNPGYYTSKFFIKLND